MVDHVAISGYNNALLFFSIMYALVLEYFLLY